MSEFGVIVILFGSVVIACFTIVAVWAVHALGQVARRPTHSIVDKSNSQTTVFAGNTSTRDIAISIVAPSKRVITVIGVPIDSLIVIVLNIPLGRLYVSVLDPLITDFRSQIYHSIVLFLATLGIYWLVAMLIYDKTPGIWLAGRISQQVLGGLGNEKHEE